MQYEVLRVMNNNVILAKHLLSSNEAVLMAKGIGFGKKKGQEVTLTDQDIEKSFVAGNKSLKESYLQMLSEVNGDIVELCTEILLIAEKKLGELSDRSFIVIVDHISFAIEKLKKNITIENPFSYEIQHLYPDEYAIGEFARQRINQVLGIDISEDEVGFIALHLNAAKQHTVVSDTLKNTRIIKALIELIEHELNLSMKDYPRLNNRLLLHLRGFLKLIDEQDDSTKHELFDVTIRMCQEAYIIAEKLGHLVSKAKKVKVNDKDLFYLTLHIDRLMRKSKSYHK